MADTAKPSPTLTDAAKQARIAKLDRLDKADKSDKADKADKADKGTIAKAPAKTDQQKVEAESAARRGAKTDNDGRADKPLGSGTNVGARDMKIQELTDKKAKVEADREQVKQEIKTLKDEVSSDETAATVAGVATDIVTSPIKAVSSLFGKKNPASEAVKSLAYKAMDTVEDRTKLETKNRDLERQADALQAQIKELKYERRLNYLADVAKVTNMPKPVADVLEGSKDIEVKVNDGPALVSDAAYRKTDKAIIVDQDVLDALDEDLKALRDRGIVDDDGNIIDEQRFDAAKEGDGAIGTAALVGVHEVTHGAQDGRGEIDAATTAGAAIEAKAEARSRKAVAGAQEGVAQLGKVEAEVDRIGRLEYDAYTNQETIELQAGKQKKGFVTINADGSLLPRDQAVQNIYALQVGAPLPHGRSAGQSFSEAVPGGVGDQLTPGRNTPGRNTPGLDTPGRNTPGRNTPGDETPGRNTPGRNTPGRNTPGRNTPGLLLG